MSLDHALLVSLLEKPSSGYELARRFDRSIGYFWHATHQQIYKVLARMEEAGWISGEVQAGEVAPDRKLYSVSAAGRTEFPAGWRNPPIRKAVRDSLMVKLRGAAFGEAGALIPELEHHRALHANRLTAYRVIEARDFSGTLDRQRALQYQVLKSGIRFEQGWLEWCEEAIALTVHEQLMKKMAATRGLFKGLPWGGPAAERKT
jgi:DNA-binding PadR family transcriptional regulator